MRAFIDADNNASTGYSYNGIGADYVIENGRLFSLLTGGKFTPKVIANSPAAIADYVDTWTVPTSTLVGAGTTLQVIYQVEGFAPMVRTPVISVTRH